MKISLFNRNQKGFIIPLLVIIIAALIIGGGLYYFNNKNQKNSGTGEEKNYIAGKKSCRVIDYGCPAGWETFEDDQGCGCKKTTSLSTSTDQTADLQKNKKICQPLPFNGRYLDVSFKRNISRETAEKDLDSLGINIRNSWQEFAYSSYDHSTGTIRSNFVIIDNRSKACVEMIKSLGSVEDASEAIPML